MTPVPGNKKSPRGLVPLLPLPVGSPRVSLTGASGTTPSYVLFLLHIGRRNLPVLLLLTPRSGAMASRFRVCVDDFECMSGLALAYISAGLGQNF